MRVYHTAATAMATEVELAGGSKFGRSSSEVVARCALPPFPISSSNNRRNREE